MIDLSVEVPVTLTHAAKLPQLQRNGQRPHVATIFRWATAGCRGVKLEVVNVGGARCTTSEAVDRWIAALTAQDQGKPAPSPARTPLRRQRDHERAQRELAEAGW